MTRLDQQKTAQVRGFVELLGFLEASRRIEVVAMGGLEPPTPAL
jgi:hypothetical protein